MSFRIIIFLILSFSFLTDGLPKNIQKKVENEIMDTFEIETFQLNSKEIGTDVTPIVKYYKSSDSTLKHYMEEFVKKYKNTDIKYLIEDILFCD